MKLLLNLYLSFFKIGLFGFGGGYAMIPLIQKELENHGWMKIKEFINIIAIAGMTPGPIAVNSGTFVGYRVSMVIGSLVATLGVITPSLILVLILANFFDRLNESPYIEAILKFLRPVVIGLILAAGLTIGKAGITDLPGLIIFLTVILLMAKTRLQPIMIIFLAGLSGIFIYS